MYKIFVFIALFLIYSFLGWLMEVIVCFPDNKKFVNRGFLIGPICPIYGFGCLLIIIFLAKYKSDPVTLFCMSVIICSIMEYVTSYIMEKLFNTRWWDYSNRKFNLNGRICLSNLVAFGVLGLLMMYLLNPFFVNIVQKINPVLLKSIVSIFTILFLIDLGVSTKIISNINGVGSTIYKDSTEEISAKVKEALKNKGMFSRRVINAFPNLKIREDILKKRIEYKKRKSNKKKNVKE